MISNISLLFQICILSFFEGGLLNPVSIQGPTAEKIKLSCLYVEKYSEAILTIQSQEELEQLYLNAPVHPPDCSMENLPIIDFANHSILGYLVWAGGCEHPEIDISLNWKGDTLIVRSDITEKGLCKVLRPYRNWWLLDKVEPVIFKLEEKRNKQ